MIESEAGSRPEPPVIRLTPGADLLRWRELWAYRELLYFLVWRDVKVRYKQTVLGAAWAIIQPFMTMVVFSIFFGRLAGMPSDGVAYPLFAYCALVPWTYFATALGNGANSLVGNQHLISKVYFPRLVIPLAAVLAPLVDAVIAFAVLLGLMAYFHHVPPAAVVLLPVLSLLAALTALAAVLWLSALNVKYRDVRYVVPFVVQFWLFASPVAYPATLVPEPWRWVYGLNPMVGVIEGFRWALLATPPPSPAMMATSSLAVAALLLGGILFYQRTEGTFADVI
ncbi:MAG: ABC transporter permease [Planctomycetes bacterium]|nr:ABC transporter permease [Planctomycetota bacterium]